MLAKKIFTLILAVLLFQQIWAGDVPENVQAVKIRAAVTSGSEWKGKFAPQLALWIQDSEGDFFQTIFVTKKASQKKFVFAPKDGRPESLPVWYHSGGNFSAPQFEDGIDAVTSATPKGGFEVVQEMRLEQGKKYFIFAEVNKSFDYNEFYPKKAEKNSAEYSGVNGQPSAVYCAEIGLENSEVEMELAGTGAVDGKSGSIENKAETLTTAKNLVEKILVSVEFSGAEK